MIRKTILSSLIAVSLAANSAYARGFDAGGFAGGLAGGIIGGAIQGAMNRKPEQKTVIVKEKTVVVHDRAPQSSHHTSKRSDSPAPKPTPESSPSPASTPTPDIRPVVNHDPAIVTTIPIKIDQPKDLNEHQMALLSDKAAVMSFFDDFFKRTKPDNSVADSSLFYEVQVGAYNFLVAKIAMNTRNSVAPLEEGFVIDLKNEFMTVLDLDTYKAFIHTGNVTLLGERHLNPLD